MRISDVMHRGVISVEPDTPVREVARTMRRDDIGATPVCENGRIIGMVTDRDIACRAVADGRDLDAVTAREIMTAGAVTCSAGDEVDEVIGLMERRKVRRIPVLDDAGAVVGMASLGDISSRVDDEDAGELLREVSAHHA